MHGEPYSTRDGSRSWGEDMKRRAIVECDPEVDSYAVYCPELPGCASAGDTEEEALTHIRETIALHLEPSPVEIKPQGKVFEVEVPA